MLCPLCTEPLPDHELLALQHLWCSHQLSMKEACAAYVNLLQQTINIEMGCRKPVAAA